MEKSREKKSEKNEARPLFPKSFSPNFFCELVDTGRVFLLKLISAFCGKIYALGSDAFRSRRIPQTKRSFYEKLRVHGYLPDG